MISNELITTEFLQKHLRNHYKNDEIEVIDFKISSATGKGENFASSIVRVTINFSVPKKDKPSTVNLIIKQSVDDEFCTAAFAQFDIYIKEMIFYDEVVPKFNRKLQELGESSLFAEPFAVLKSENILILEDLSASGYRVLPAKEGFKFDEAKILLKKLAVFHAISAVLQEEHPNIFEKFKYGHISRGTDAFDNYYAFTCDALIEVISEWPEFDVYAEKLQRIRNDVAERGRDAYDSKPNQFNTLNHDDPWFTNFMIKTKDNQFENVLLIDFQFSYWSSPTTDLYYFLNSSLRDEDRPERIDELVQYYHECLAVYLIRAGYKKHIPNWPEFEEQYRERKFLAFITTCLIQPLQINNTEEASMGDFCQDDERGLKARRGLFKGDRIQANLRKLIPYYDKLGTFD